MFNQLANAFRAPTFADDEAKTRRAYLLDFIVKATAVMALFQLPAILGYDFSARRALIVIPIILMSVAFVVFTKILINRGSIQTGTYFFLAINWIGTTAVLVLSGGGGSEIYINYALLIITTALLLQDKRHLIIATVGTIAVNGLLVFLQSREIVPVYRVLHFEGGFAWFIRSFYLVMAAVLLYIAVEQIASALSKLNVVNRRLAEVGEQLEMRVNAQTRELELVSEISRSLSRQLDLDKLLQQSVESIRERFNLYYVQIYLTNPSGQTLILRAGTGQVGQELVSRGHRLPVGSGSINGVAAAYKEPVLVPDTTASSMFRANTFLPDTRSELSIPLTVGERVVGVLDLQGSRANALSHSEIPAFSLLASQLAVAIENASLFETTKRSQREMEQHARETTHIAWDEYLNAIDRGEEVGFAFDGYEVQPAVEVDWSSFDLQMPIKLNDAPIGTVAVASQGNGRLSEDYEILLTAVAEQISLHAENLRLLSQTEKYRLEAEAAVKRLTRENWEQYRLRGLAPGYEYDQEQVIPVNEEYDSEIPSRLTREIVVNGQAIARVDVVTEEHTVQVNEEVVTTLADILAEHMENLRLAEETERTLFRTEEMFNGSERIIRSTDYQDILIAILDTTALWKMDGAFLTLFDTSWEESTPGDQTIVAYWTQAGNTLELPPHTIITKEFIQHTSMVQQHEVVVIEDLTTDDRISESVRERVISFMGAHSLINVPLVAADRWVGMILSYSQQPVQVSEDEIRQMLSLASQAAVVIQTQQLFEEARARARREQMLREITARVHTAVDPDIILQTAAKEVQRALGLETFVYLENDVTQPHTNGKQTANEG